jgi:hypothetical protein
MHPIPSIPLNDRRLWGNEAADDEDPEVLDSYFVSQDAWADFFNAGVPLSIARARKGMGKSALIRECAFRVTRQDNALVLSIKGSDLVAQKEFKAQSPLEHIFDWQQRICTAVARRLGASIGLAVDDDRISLVEAAELAGFKSRNLVGLIVDRLKGRLGKIELAKLDIQDNKALLSRYFSGSDESVWLLVDDIDATFGGSDDEILRLATFFSACRDLASNYRGLTIRISVRSDVWSLIRRKNEALDKAEQYIFDIHWTKKEFRKLLSERILSYMKRSSVDGAEGASEDELMNAVFDAKFRWGTAYASPHRVIYTYAAGRPRWAAQLCRLAGGEAVSVGSPRIKIGHVNQILEKYGRFRLDDVSREHRNQCTSLSEIVNAFAAREAVYTTDALLAHIDGEILKHVSVEIEGRRNVTSLEVANLLFRTGFIIARDFRGSGVVEYYHFEEKDRLLQNRANLDDGLTWYVHPAFHRALTLRHTSAG